MGNQHVNRTENLKNLDETKSFDRFFNHNVIQGLSEGSSLKYKQSGEYLCISGIRCTAGCWPLLSL